MTLLTFVNDKIRALLLAIADAFTLNSVDPTLIDSISIVKLKALLAEGLSSITFDTGSKISAGEDLPTTDLHHGDIFLCSDDTSRPLWVYDAGIPAWRSPTWTDE